ncbi:MAG: threonine synthase, partial [Clostridia bacterium]|nr:threonine synthase [Clostridia bacterium]
MDFYSTRGEGPVSGAKAIVNGIAKDGGLYVPSSFPKITADDLADMADLEYYERAAYIMSLYLDEFDYEELVGYAKAAYDRFDGDPAPLTKVDEQTYILELWHGPTLAFKDIALTMLPHLVAACKKKLGEDKKTLILVATSGDTGKAALEGFKDVEGTEIVVLYPSQGVSDMQKRQMITTEGKNVHVIGIEGNFDDAQRAVKRIFTDKNMKEEFSKLGFDLSSANSINFGRLLPQIAYYVSSYVDLLTNELIGEGEEINFVVPSGNFGNVLAAYYAKRMGLPVKQLIVASNKNDVLTEFFTDGVYDANRDFFKTMSPSMDILVSSNLERLLYELGDRNPTFVQSLMKKLADGGYYSVDEDDLYEKLPEFLAYSATEEETKEVIDNFFDEYSYLLDPHTAVAVSAFFKYMTETYDNTTSTVIVSTAN